MRVISVMFLAGLLSAASVAHATDTPAPTTPPAATPAQEEPRNNRQEFREEMQHIRSEHDALHVEHEKWQSECGHKEREKEKAGEGKPQPVLSPEVQASCAERLNVLNEKRAALHQRLTTLHHKMQQ